MRYGRFTNGMYCADEITTQLAGPGISDSQSMSLLRVSSVVRFINISVWLWRAPRLGGSRGKRGGRVQGGTVVAVVALVAPWR